MFCRFLEFYLVSAFNADYAIGIIATIFAVRRSDQREWGTWYAYGIVGRLFPEARSPEPPG